MEKLLNGKLSKDCVSVVCKYLHRNDIEIVKKAMDDNYELDLEYPWWDLNVDFNVFANYVDWVVASEDDVGLLCDNIGDISDDETVTLDLKIRAIKYILEKKVVPFEYYFLCADVHISKLIVEFYGKEYLLQNYPKVIDEYLNNGYIVDLKTIDYLYNIGFRPTIIEVYFIIYYHKRSIWEWAITHGFTLTYDTFYEVLSAGWNNDKTADTIAWLLDHNCPYKP